MGRGVTACPNLFTPLLVSAEACQPRSTRSRQPLAYLLARYGEMSAFQRCGWATLRSHGVTIANQSRIAVSSDRLAERELNS